PPPSERGATKLATRTGTERGLELLTGEGDLSPLAAENDLLPSTAAASTPLGPVLDVGAEARSWYEWFADLWHHREVLSALARKDFQTRYKRASFGVVWAVAVPVIQGAVMAVVFSKVVK